MSDAVLISLIPPIVGLIGWAWREHNGRIQAEWSSREKDLRLKQFEDESARTHRESSLLRQDVQRIVDDSITERWGTLQTAEGNSWRSTPSRPIANPRRRRSS